MKKIAFTIFSSIFLVCIVAFVVLSHSVHAQSTSSFPRSMYGTIQVVPGDKIEHIDMWATYGDLPDKIFFDSYAGDSGNTVKTQDWGVPGSGDNANFSATCQICGGKDKLYIHIAKNGYDTMVYGPYDMTKPPVEREILTDTGTAMVTDPFDLR
ncbi:MAG: hypothetical protein WCP97_08400, partial [bacterium]